jgi:hypothetical protein
MKLCGLILGITGMLVASGGPGIRPRANSSDYAAHQAAGGVDVGASVLSPDQVHKMFATDLNAGGYIVLEVAVYPEAGKQADISADDFLLRAGTNSESVRAANARAIATILQAKNAQRPGKASDVTVYPTATVGYESGGYDPVTGRRVHGVYTGAGVGAGIGEPQPPGPAPTGRDRYTMEQELNDKALPEGKTDKAVAGYLYFPKISGKGKPATYDLTYYGQAGQVQLHLPVPAK